MKATLLGFITVVCGLLTTSASDHVRAATITLTPQADAYLRDATARGALGFIDVRGGSIDFRGYVRFDLAAIPAGSTINSASFALTQVSGASRNDAVTTGRVSTYGLDNAVGNTPQNWDETTFVPADKGTENVATLAGVIDLDDNVTGISESLSGTPAIFTVTGGPLASFLQTRFDDGALATFILSNDESTDRGFGFGSKENADPNTQPTLTIDFTPIPEPASSVLLAAGLGLAALRRRV